MTLSGIIIQKIQNDGPISFRDFMEMSLYYPDLGYYTSSKEKIGKSGDFLTGPVMSPVFGAMVGKQLEDMWLMMGGGEFTVVEYGAGTGALCHNILGFLKSNSRLYGNLRYCIIEKSPAMREKSKCLLQDKVSWYDSIRDIPDLKGCVLSNELVDNLSVHVVVMEEELMEVFVDYDNGFKEVLRPAGEDLKNYFRELQVELPRSFRTEVNLEATSWIKEVSESLQQGYVLTIDYGYPSHELYQSYRRNGTLICYNKHKINDRPYSSIGEQDITAHVNFSALCLWGYKNGLEFSGFTNQRQFLMSLGFPEYIKQTETPGEDYKNFKREMFLTQTLLKEMGDKFKVLIQHKELPKKELLGLRA